MERQPTRPIAPGKIREYLRRTTMPRHVPPFLPSFEARPKIHSVSCCAVAQSGDSELDALAQAMWDHRDIKPQHSAPPGPPPLAPLSGGRWDKPAPKPLAPGSGVKKDKPAPKPEEETATTPLIPEQRQAPSEEDFANDVLNVTPGDLGGLEDADDLFRGITVTRNSRRRTRRWVVFPAGRPKVEVRMPSLMI